MLACRKDMPCSFPAKLTPFTVTLPSQSRLNCLADNADVFLKPSGWVMIAVKSQSIDVTMDPEAVYGKKRIFCENRGFEVKEIVNLGAF